MSEEDKEKKSEESKEEKKDPVPASPARDKLHEKFPEKIEDVPSARGEVIVSAPLDDLLDVLHFLKRDEELRFDFLADMTAIDSRKEKEAFELVYELISLREGYRIRVKSAVKEGKEAPSVTSLWATANWAEREVFDMFGISFYGHPKMGRILMPDDWSGHPLRKDYPLRGPREEHQTPWNWYDAPSNLAGGVPAKKKLEEQES